MSEEEFPDALPPGHRLHWYVLERVLGQGGFGITYLAHDTNLDRRVAIKEYLPAEVARRRSDASARPRTESHTERFAWGLERFLAEARTLARFDHPNIVRVLSIFEANDTAYMVMRFEEGEDLGTLLDRCGTLPQKELLDCLLPVLGGLQLIHSSGFIHRDVKPENIYMRDDGSPVLLDFGSARQSFGSAKTMTILVAPGYAPLEQYYGDAKTQGPWTDIYGLAATCYRAVTGRPPLDAIARAKGVLGSTRDLLEPAAAVAKDRYEASLLAAIDHGLQLGERDRPQSIAEWRRQIVAAAPATAPAVASPAVPTAPTAVPPSGLVVPTPGALDATAPATARGPRPGRRGAVLAGVGAVLLCGLAVLATRAVRDGSSPPEAKPAVAQGPAAEVKQEPVAAPNVVAPTSPAVASDRGEPPPRRDREESALPAVRPGPGLNAAARESGTTPAKEGQARTVAAVLAPAPARQQATPARSLPAAAPTPVAPPGRDPSPAGTLLMTAPTANAPVPAALSPPVVATAPVAVPSTGSRAPAHDTTASIRRDQQLDAAESALRRGDAAGAAQIAAPWAAAGVARAQTLLGRAQEARSQEQRSDFEAYVWYSIAARNGEAGAQTLKEKVAGRLQPAEVRQAEQIVERWKPRPEGSGEPAERSTP